MLTRTWTGVIRARFAGSGKPWMWRTLHAAAYLAWPLGITHGLTAGRPAKTWVTLSYMGCVLFVLIGLLRLVTGEDDERPFRRSRSARHRRDEDDNVDPGYGRPYPYVLAVDPAPSRRARPGRRAAGGGQQPPQVPILWPAAAKYGARPAPASGVADANEFVLRMWSARIGG